VLAVPEITQVVLLIDAHAGSAGEIVQLVMADPLFVKVVGVTDILCPKLLAVPTAPT
jgi:hypothetical protein